LFRLLPLDVFSLDGVLFRGISRASSGPIAKCRAHHRKQQVRS